MPEKPGAVRLRVGKNVRRLRRLRGLSQERLAERVGNSVKHIGQVERGEVNVGLDILSRIAIALSIDVDDLFIGPRSRRKPDFLVIPANVMDQVERALRGIRASRSQRSPRAAG